MEKRLLSLTQKKGSSLFESNHLSLKWLYNFPWQWNEENSRIFRISRDKVQIHCNESSAKATLGTVKESYPKSLILAKKANTRLPRIVFKDCVMSTAILHLIYFWDPENLKFSSFRPEAKCCDLNENFPDIFITNILSLDTIYFITPSKLDNVPWTHCPAIL